MIIATLKTWQQFFKLQLKFKKDENSWYMPEFPIIREETCEFLLWETKSELQEAVLKGKSRVIHVKNALETPTAIH